MLALRARDAAVGGAAIAEGVAADVVASCAFNRPRTWISDPGEWFRARLLLRLSSLAKVEGRTADLGAGHEVKDEAKAGQAVYGEVEHSRGTARRCWRAHVAQSVSVHRASRQSLPEGEGGGLTRFAGRDRGAAELERLEASLVLRDGDGIPLFSTAARVWKRASAGGAPAPWNSRCTGTTTRRRTRQSHLRTSTGLQVVFFISLRFSEVPVTEWERARTGRPFPRLSVVELLLLWLLIVRSWLRRRRSSSVELLLLSLMRNARLWLLLSGGRHGRRRCIHRRVRLLALRVAVHTLWGVVRYAQRRGER